VGSFVAEGVQLFFRAIFKAGLKDQDGAAKDLEQALELPAIFPIRRFCLVYLANHKLKLASRSADSAQLYADVRACLRKAYGLGKMNPQLKQNYLDALIRSGDLEFAADLAGEWGNRKALERITQIKRGH